MKKIKDIMESRSQNFWMFNLYSAIQNIGKTISSIFIPIILLQIGFSFLEVILYYVMFYGIDIILNIVSKNFIVKFGVKKAFFIATISLIIFFVLYTELTQGD
jgi:hypothetical protein